MSIHNMSFSELKIKILFNPNYLEYAKKFEARFSDWVIDLKLIFLAGNLDQNDLDLFYKITGKTIHLKEFYGLSFKDNTYDNRWIRATFIDRFKPQETLYETLPLHTSANQRVIFIDKNQEDVFWLPIENDYVIAQQTRISKEHAWNGQHNGGNKQYYSVYSEPVWIDSELKLTQYEANSIKTHFYSGFNKPLTQTIPRAYAKIVYGRAGHKESLLETNNKLNIIRARKISYIFANTQDHLQKIKNL